MNARTIGVQDNIKFRVRHALSHEVMISVVVQLDPGKVDFIAEVREEIMTRFIPSARVAVTTNKYSSCWMFLLKFLNINSQTC